MGIVIGITGGIATGKSAVVGMFAKLGAQCVDADKIARDVLSPRSKAVQQVVLAFGPEFVDEKGIVDRARLGELIFSDSSARETLNRITHPRIIRTMEEQIGRFRTEARPGDVLVAEIPLLIETNLTRMVDKVILVAAEQEAQESRLKSRSVLTDEQIRHRIESQMPACQKMEVADWVIDTNGSIEDTALQVKRVWDEVQATASSG